MARRFTTVDSKQASKSLARRFIPLADSLRDMLTRFGLRAYKVTQVRIQWSGLSRGSGTPTTVAEDVMLPTPKLSGVNALGQVVQPVGLDELGSLEMSQVSGRFSEDSLLGRGPGGTPIPPNEEFFYEVEFFPADDGPSVRRRFFPDSAPVYKPGALQWTMRLVKANNDRERNGDPGW